ncbi:MAG: restriction endonuclease subunit S [Verrucomicrobiae bacterium]|nr:restriction endonuclease subunit S [Verrucomicrobiae bacterium]
MKWNRSTLGEIAKRTSSVIQTGPFGSQLHQHEYEDEGVPVIMPKDISGGRVLEESVARISETTAERLNRHRLNPRTLVVPRRGDVTKRAFITADQDGWLCGTGCLKIELKGDVLSPEYLYYFMEQEDVVSWIRQNSVGTTMLNLSAAIIADLPVAYPDFPSQSRIASILTTYDDLIENNRRRMTLLEESARLLYREWFVHFRFPGHESTRFSNGLPEGWERGHIGDFIDQGAVDLQTGPFGTQLKASDYTEDGTPVINVRNIGYGDLRPDKLEFVPEEIAERLSVHLLRPDDIVFGRKGAVDRHILITQAHDGWMQGSDCIRLRSLTEQVCPVILSFAFREPSHHDWMLTQCGNKATMASLNQSVIGRIPILVPCEKIRSEFQVYTRDLLNQIANLTSQNQKLKTARDLLLPRLMSGEIEV